MLEGPCNLIIKTPRGQSYRFAVYGLREFKTLGLRIYRMQQAHTGGGPALLLLVLPNGWQVNVLGENMVFGSEALFKHGAAEVWKKILDAAGGAQGNPFEDPEPPDDQYDPRELAKGIEVELEHTQDRRIAKRIAKDHLDENKSYYRKLATLGLNPDIRSNPEVVAEVDGQRHVLKPMAAFYGWPGKVWTRMVTQDPYSWQAGALVLFYDELREAYVLSDISASDARRQVIRRMLGDLK
jgi:hypothetical protein